MSIISMGTKIVDLRRAVGSGSGGGAFSTKSLLFNPALDWVQSYPVYSALDGLDNFAVSFWIKFDDLTSNKNIFGISNQPLAGGDLRDQQIQCAWNSTGNWLQIYFNDITTYCYTDPLIWTPVTGTWYHVLITRDTNRVGDKCKVYVDGDDCLNGETGTQPTLNTSTSGIYIGDSDGLLNSSITGNIDEFAIYTQDMAAYKDEIYNGGTPDDLDNLPTAPSPNVWYRMGENATFKEPQILMPENSNKDKVSNYSMSFDGVSSYIDTSNATLVNGYTDVTFSGWINVSSLAAAFEGILCSRSSDYILIHIGNIVGSTYTLYIQQVQSGQPATITYTLSLDFDSWYHFAIMGSVGGKWDMYINGSNAAQVQGSNTISGLTQTKSFEIGRDYATRELVGKIDEVSIFNEVKAIGDLWDGTGKPTDLTGESGIVSWWRMGEEAIFDAAATEWAIPDQAGSNDGVSASMDIYARTGDAPDSPNNALSYNMDAVDIVEDTPPNP